MFGYAELLFEGLHDKFCGFRFLLLKKTVEGATKKTSLQSSTHVTNICNNFGMCISEIS